MTAVGMLDTISLYDDELMEAMLEGDEPSEEQIHKAVRRATIAREITPVFMGSAYRNKGVQEVLDAVRATQHCRHADVAGHHRPDRQQYQGHRHGRRRVRTDGWGDAWRAAPDGGDTVHGPRDIRPRTGGGRAPQQIAGA